MVLFLSALSAGEVRSGLFTYAIFCFAAAWGLWRVKRWGRSVALVLAMGNIGLGGLVLVSVLISNEGDAVIPSVLLGSNVVLGYVLSRPIFDLPADSNIGAAGE